MILSKSIFNLFVTQAKNQKIGFVKLEQEQEANQVRQINPYYGKRVILNINLKQINILLNINLKNTH